MSQYPPPADNWMGPDAGSRRPRNSGSLVIAMIVGAVLFGAGCGGGLIVGWFAGLSNTIGEVWSEELAGMNEPVDAKLSVAFPDEIRVGDRFDLVVSVTDTSNAPRTIDMVSIGEELSMEFRYHGVDPKPESSSGSAEYRSYEYTLNMPPNGTSDFTFDIQANEAGIHTGTLTVMFDDWRSLSNIVTIEVLPKE